MGCITRPQLFPSSSYPIARDPVRGAACTSLAAAVSSEHKTSDSSAVAPVADASSLVLPPVATACQQPADDSQPKPGSCAPAELSFDRAVDLTLSALARSVAVRCQCIDQHSPVKQPASPAIVPTEALSSPSALPRNADTPEVQPCADSSAAQQAGNPIQLHAAQMHDGCMQEGRAQQHVNSHTSAPMLQPGPAMLNARQGPDALQEEEGVPGALDQLPPSETDFQPSGTAGYPSKIAVNPSDTTVSPSEAFLHSCVTAAQPPGTTSCPAEAPAHPSDTASRPSETSPHFPETTAQSTSRHEAATLQPAPVLILFSGGVDSTLIAALAHQALPADVPIDLASVCFTGGRSGDRQAALDAVQELAHFAPAREWRLIQVDSSLEEVDKHKDWLLGTDPIVIMLCHATAACAELYLKL